MGPWRQWRIVLLLVGMPLVSAADFPRDCNPTSISDADILNFHEVDAEVYRGARPHCSAYAKLARLGIKTILDLEGNTNETIEGCGLKPNQFRYISFRIGPAEPALAGVSIEKLHRLFQILQDAPKPIFISCRYGKDRTGTIVAIYRMKQGELSFEQAKREALYYNLSRRFIGLRRTLLRYRDPALLNSLPAPGPPQRSGSSCAPATILTDEPKKLRLSSRLR
jgi:tyrosine-protein phosphatase SIW14